MTSLRRISAALLPLLLVCPSVTCFTPTAALISPTTTTTFSAPSKSKLHSHGDDREPSSSNKSVEIVLFGIGDLRTNDHVGLRRAILSLEKDESPEKAILPVVILDAKSTLPNLPMGVTHMWESSKLISSAVNDLSDNLESLGLHLRIVRSLSGVLEQLETVVEGVKAEEGVSSVNVHVYDLGDADVSMGYGPYSFLRGESLSLSGVRIIPWKCDLRDRPWEDMEEKNFQTRSFPEYEKQYMNEKPLPPLPPPPLTKTANEEMSQSKDKTTPEEIHSLLLSAFQSPTTSTSDKHTAFTGMYGTHWGGVNGAVCTETDSLNCLKAYAKSREDPSQDLNEVFGREFLANTVAHRNGASLEHAAMTWFDPLIGTNVMEAEMVVRYLAAPLLLGCVSSRQLWHASKEDSENNNPIQAFWGKTQPMRETAEAREWHRLLAASEMQRQTEEASSNAIQYRYWRWHGFLCRYAISSLLAEAVTNDTAESDVTEEISQEEKHGMVLIHGFGASSSQWEGTIRQLSSQHPQKSGHPTLALAPDLIGFGQAEKPGITYTQYLWEAFAQDFVKEIGIYQNGLDGYYLAGNSIGGYVSMASAADDDVGQRMSASGAEGMGKCKGLILMNSAGRVFSREDITAMEQKGAVDLSVAEITLDVDSLGKCSPPPRPLAKVFGNALLGYLRPRIQSITKPLYPANPAAITDELCSGILRDSLDPGAVYVMMSGAKLPPPRTANELLNGDFGNSNDRSPEGTFQGPVLVCQGLKDPLNDSTERARLLKGLREGVTLFALEEAGHCVHDELPQDVARGIWEWVGATQNAKASPLLS